MIEQECNYIPNKHSSKKVRIAVKNAHTLIVFTQEDPTIFSGYPLALIDWKTNDKCGPNTILHGTYPTLIYLLLTPPLWVGSLDLVSESTSNRVTNLCFRFVHHLSNKEVTALCLNGDCLVCFRASKLQNIKMYSILGLVAEKQSRFQFANMTHPIFRAKWHTMNHTSFLWPAIYVGYLPQ